MHRVWGRRRGGRRFKLAIEPLGRRAMLADGEPPFAASLGGHDGGDLVATATATRQTALPTGGLLLRFERVGLAPYATGGSGVTTFFNHSGFADGSPVSSDKPRANDSWSPEGRTCRRDRSGVSGTRPLTHADGASPARRPPTAARRR
jgi:hypothetical protein